MSNLNSIYLILNVTRTTDFIVRRGNIDIRDLYSESPDAKYYYVFGTNWRAVFAFIAGFTVPLPGERLPGQSTILALLIHM